MGNVSQGTTVTWAGVELGEVLSVSVDGVQADTVEITPRTQSSRYKSYRVADVEVGTVSVTCRGTAAMSSSNVGLTGLLTIAGPSVSWSFSNAIFERIGWSATLGELQAYSISFKLSN